MDAAIKAVLRETAGSINAAARDHGVPPTTLKNRLSGRVIHGTNPGPIPYLSSMEEEELVEYLREANRAGYGKTRSQVKVIAQRVALDKGVLRGARISDGWWRRFLERHPDLSLRSGDSTGFVRMDAMNEQNLRTYFDLLNSVLEENNLKVHPEQIYNMGCPLILVHQKWLHFVVRRKSGISVQVRKAR
jgi:transposase-like protein